MWTWLCDKTTWAVGVVRNLVETNFHIAFETLLILTLFVLLLVICLPIMFCCQRLRKQPTNSYTKRDVICKKGFFALMLARLDEFDTLTPLIVTPATVAPEFVPTTDFKQSPSMVRTTSLRSSDSPPPPRRTNHGKTLIVPLNTGRYRAPAVPLLGTPDSKVSTFDQGTTKSCATIPEDDEEEVTNDDLLSIDRTSTSDPRCNLRTNQKYFYNITLPQPPPEFEHDYSPITPVMPVPMYSPPDIPASVSVRPTYLQRQTVDVGTSPPQQSPNANGSGRSPNSSIGTESPIDTTGSLSDSFYINSDVISSTNGSQVIYDGATYNESDTQSKYQLHRIEEESEALDVDHDRNILVPRSISQQFEMLRRGN